MIFRFLTLFIFIFHFSILPESPRWLISKQRYHDAELIFQHIAEKNNTHFDPTTYQRFVDEDKKVTTKARYLCLMYT
jgi:hypothetical protein